MKKIIITTLSVTLLVLGVFLIYKIYLDDLKMRCITSIDNNLNYINICIQRGDLYP